MIARDNLGYRRPVLDGLDSWCAARLGCRPVERLFTSGHLSRVIGLVLEDGRRVVVKVRPAAQRLHGCVALQRYLSQAGFPCPRPLTGITLLDGAAAHAETLVAGEVGTPDAADRYASLLAELVRIGRDAPLVPSLAPPPAWVDWDHGGSGLWPAPDDRDVDLNALAEERWLDDTGRRAVWRLAELRDAPPVYGHADWEAQNIRWRTVPGQGGVPVVDDWDSAVRLPEVAMVGHAAAVWTAGPSSGFPTVAQTEEFLDAYQHAAGRTFTVEEERQAWGAGLWTRAFNAKKWMHDGIEVLTADEAAERMRRAVIEPHFM
jgi:hypothetical protein